MSILRFTLVEMAFQHKIRHMSKLRTSRTFSSFSSIFDGSFIHKQKKKADASNETLDFKSNYGFLIKDFFGEKSTDLRSVKGDQVSIIASVSEKEYICRGVDNKIGTIPIDFLNLDTVSRFEIPNIQDYRALADIPSDKSLSSFLELYENLESEKLIKTRTRRSISQPPLFVVTGLDKVEIKKSLASVKVGKLSATQSNTFGPLIANVMTDLENKKIIIEEEWSLSEILNILLDKFKIVEKDKYQLLITNNNSLVPLTEALLAAFKKNKSEKNLYIKKKQIPAKPSVEINSPSLTSPLFNAGSFSKPKSRIIEAKPLFATLTKDYQGMNDFDCLKGDQVVVVAYIDSQLYVCRNADSIINAVSLDYLNFMGPKSELPSLDQYKKVAIKDPYFSEFLLEYQGNNFLNVDGRSKKKELRHRSRSQPIPPDVTVLDLKPMSFNSIKDAKKSITIDELKPITLTVVGDNNEKKKIIVDVGWTFLAVQKLIFEKFKVKEPEKMQFLMTSHSGTVELTDLQFYKILVDSKSEKTIYLKPKFQISQLNVLNDFTEYETSAPSSLTPHLSLTITPSPKRGSTDTTSSISSNADSILNGPFFRVVNKGSAFPPSPDSPEILGIQTVVKGKLLGRGISGTVYLGMDSRTGKSVAIKEIELSNKFSAEIQQHTVHDVLKRETMFLRKLKHDHIVEYFGYNMIDGKLQLLLEYVPGGISFLFRKHSKYVQVIHQTPRLSC